MEEQEEQFCRFGDEAEVLLKTPAFDATINQLVDSSFQAFVNSKPEDKDARERSYAHYRALVDIVSTLQQRVSVRDEVQAKIAQNDNSLEE